MHFPSGPVGVNEVGRAELAARCQGGVQAVCHGRTALAPEMSADEHESEDGRVQLCLLTPATPWALKLRTPALE